MRRIKKLCSIVLAAAMIVSGIPCLSTGQSSDEGRIAYAAEEGTTVASGSCGATENDTVTWKLDGNGTFTISGNGAMKKYYDSAAVPWSGMRTAIQKVVVEEGVTSIGGLSFFNCYNITSVTLADSVETMEIYAFYNCWQLASIQLGSGIKKLGYDSMAGTALSEITFPASMTTLDSGALSYCTDLKKITFLGAAPTVETTTFYGNEAMNIVYSSAQEGWNEAKTTWTVPDGTIWHNMDEQIKPSEFHFQQSVYELAEGEDLTLTTTADELLTMDLTFSSDHPEFFYVGKSGTGSGLKAGTCTVTAKNSDGTYSASCTVVVRAASIGDSGKVTTDEPAEIVSNNQSAQNLGRYGAADWSNLYQEKDGSYTRVEFLQTTEGGADSQNRTYKVAVIKYSSDYVLQSQKLIEPELKLFGGIFHGEEYNFLVFGQANPEERDDCEVVRVVKYDQSWNRLDACSIYGANTYLPFEAGSLEMTECDGKLYIHTCHEMYKSSDGWNHQANMTFVLDQTSMKVLDSFYDVMNISTGYVSHSFNQKLRTDTTSLFRVDHGDAYPRSVVITKVNLNGTVGAVERSTELLPIAGGVGDNSTGVTLGDFELSSDFCVVTGSSIMQDESWNPTGQKNIFLSACNKNLEGHAFAWVTNYDSEANIYVGTPHLVKLSSDSMLLLWEETNQNTGKTTTKMTLVAGDGRTTTGITEAFIRLSDCQPIVNRDGQVVWYVTDGSGTATFYKINPYNMLTGIEGAPDTFSGILGDVDGNGTVDASDALEILKAVVHLTVLNESQTSAADVDGNESVDATDALNVLKKVVHLIKVFPIEEK